MKKKYQIALVVIGCLVVLIGLSYAYFVATSTGGGAGGDVTVNTYTIDNVGFSIEGILEFNDLDIYPGHKNVSQIKVTAIGNDDIINYKLLWEGINSLNTPLKYYVYKTDTKENPSITCKKEIEQIGASKYYYETCEESNFTNLGEIISEGEITKAESNTEFVLKNDEVIKGTSEGNVIYYYVVLEYPNLDESQNIDMGGKFEGVVTVKKDEEAIVDLSIKKMYQETANGYEEITSMPKEGYMLNSEKSTCSNNAIPVAKGRKILITNLTTSNTECNIYFDKDKEKPIITNVATSAAETEIMVTVEATDNLEVVEYWYAIDDGKFVKGGGNVHIFRDLMPKTTHTVKVYAKDVAGNESEISSAVVTTIDITNPVISSVTTSVTTTEITVNVIASDNVGVTEYWYQLDGNAAVMGAGATHTFTSLTGGSTHTIRVYVKDADGNQSATTTNNVTTSKPTAEDTIGNLGITVNDGTPNFATAATTDEGVFKVADPVYGGTSYYWRGKVTNNYVKFGGFCWRIIRINGDGSIRMIYDGTTCHANGTSTAESIAKPSTAYNTSYNNSSYVGWTYTAGTQRTLSGTASNAKTQLEAWYNSSLVSYASKIADGKYCNDRRTQNDEAWRATGATQYYAGYQRSTSTYQPTLACDAGDVYTLKVGLITVDEVMMAGGKYGTNNTSYYLYNGQHYWTMSPYNWNSSKAGVFYVHSNGYLTFTYVYNTYIGLRPVINLKSDTTFAIGGNGTQSNPYVVQ